MLEDVTEFSFCLFQLEVVINLQPTEKNQDEQLRGYDFYMAVNTSNPEDDDNVQVLNLASIDVAPPVALTAFAIFHLLSSAVT